MAKQVKRTSKPKTAKRKSQSKKPKSYFEIVKSYNGFVPDMWHELGASGNTSVDKWKTVEEPSKMQLESLVQETTAFACARWIANIVASTPLRLLLATDDDTDIQTPKHKRKEIKNKAWFENHKALRGSSINEEIVDHAWLDLMEEPNPWLDGHSMKELWSYFIDATGEAFTEIQEKGGILSLWVYPPHQVMPVLDENNQTVEYYEINSGTANVRTVQPEDMLVMNQRDLHFPLAYGRGNLRNAYELINVEKLMLSYQATTMENGGTPSAILSPKEEMGQVESQRAAKSFQQMFKQAGSGGILFLSEPFTYNQLSIAPKDVLSMEQLTHVANKIAQSFGIPLALIDSSSVSADATYFSAIRQALQVAVIPRLRKIENVLNRFVKKYDDRLYFAFDDPMPKNEAFELQLWTAHIQGVSSGVLKPNEFRLMHGLPAIEGGDKLNTPQPIMPSSAIQEIRSAKAPNYRSKPHSPAPLTSELKEFFADQEKAVMQSLLYSKDAKAYDPTINLDDWTEELYERTFPVMRIWTEKTSESFMTSFGVERDEWSVVQENIHQTLQNNVMNFCIETQKTTSLQINDAIIKLKDELEQGIVEGNFRTLLVDRVQKVFEFASNERAWRIATTEESSTRHTAEIGTARETGVDGKKWLRDVLNNCPDCALIASKNPDFVGLDHKFFESKYSDGLNPPAHPHCTCSLTWRVNGQRN